MLLLVTTGEPDIGSSPADGPDDQLRPPGAGGMADMAMTAPPPGVLFDEAWYLAEYPAVAEVVRAGGFASGWHHYLLHGKSEGRQPASLTRIAEAMEQAGTSDAPASDSSPFWKHNGSGFLSPEDLNVTPIGARRIALLGSGKPDAWRMFDIASRNISIDLIATEPDHEPFALSRDEAARYDFVVVKVALADVIGDDDTQGLPYDDLAAHAAAFARIRARLKSILTRWLRWNREHRTLTFVANFLVPQNNGMGRLYPRHDLRNPDFMIAELNRYLEYFVCQHQNAYVLNIDRIGSSAGRRFFQSDLLFPDNDGDLLNPDFHDPGWIEPLASLAEHYEVKGHRVFSRMVWSELWAMFRSARSVDPIRVVAIEPVDLLWRSGTGFKGPDEVLRHDGWPDGVTEALRVLQKRGIRVIIVTQNDPAFITHHLADIFRSRSFPGQMPEIRAGWDSKAAMMRDLLEEAQISSRQALYIDPDPAERAAMRAAFPDMRILGGEPYYLRRILLGAPELQHAADDGGPFQTGLPAAENAVQDKAGPMSDTALERAKQTLDGLWLKAMNNTLTSAEADDIRRLSMAIAVTLRGIRRVRPFKDWATK